MEQHDGSAADVSTLATTTAFSSALARISLVICILHADGGDSDGVRKSAWPSERIDSARRARSTSYGDA